MSKHIIWDWEGLVPSQFESRTRRRTPDALPSPDSAPETGCGSAVTAHIANAKIAPARLFIAFSFFICPRTSDIIPLGHPSMVSDSEP
jgi:hypothetical protein